MAMSEMENNSPSIEDILDPIISLSWFLGGGLPHPSHKSKTDTIILCITHLVMSSIIIAYDVTHSSIFDNVKSNTFKIMYYINKMIWYMLACYYVYDGIKQYDKWSKLMKKIKNLDKQLKEVTGKSMNNRLIKNIEILAILVIIVFSLLSLIIHILYHYFTCPEDILASDLLLYYMIAQSLINNFVFDIIIYVLFCRFRMINTFLMDFANVQVNSNQIKRIKELHKKICDLVTMISNIYGFRLLLCSTNCFTMVVVMLFGIYIGVIERYYVFMLMSNLLWILYAVQFGLMCWICTLIRQEFKKTGTIICTINNNWPATNLNSTRNEGCIRNELKYFFIQLQQHQVAITACSFFQINNGLFSSFVGVIINYLIICIQFHDPKICSLKSTENVINSHITSDIL
ncbi:uncharacterized protein [Anoplolepis gracilipes]|uniref:uncharacterized protein n=1 Tax=Anoplolepis gracilipes TaxID=354296 RepID=UPI003B9E42B0